MIKKVLIVDDISANLYMLETMLKGHGFEVISAENGKDALDKARLNPPDMIVTDILMPVMDGYTLCQKCKSDEKLKNIPFVIYTATYTEPKDEKFALDLGADRFIVKPKDPEALLEILTELQDEKRNMRPDASKPLGEEMEFFRRYNEILFSKLEKKMLDLEAANQELRTLEEKYRLSFENINDVIFVVDADFKILSMSGGVEKEVGYSPQDFIGRSVADLGSIFTPQSLERAISHASRVFKGEFVPPSIYEVIAKDGTIKITEVSGSPIMHDGNISGMVAVARDITQRKQMEDALKKSEENFRNFLNNSMMGVRIVSDDGTTLYANQAILDLFGFASIDELKNTPVTKCYTRESLAENKMRREERKRGGIGPLNYVVSIIRKNGEVRHLDVFRKEIIWDGARRFQVLYNDTTERKRAEEELQQTLDRLSKAMTTTVHLLAGAVEARDPCTAGHQTRAAHLARAIATEMEIPRDKIDGIGLVGSIHDIGKLSVPAVILTKSSKLTKVEFALIKEHAVKGYEMLKDVESSWPLAEIVYQHHERMDGSGYPRHLKGDEILLEARILAVADVVEAMASHRPYRPSLGIDLALEEIEKNKGILYEEAVAMACVKLFREKGYQLP